MRGMDYHYDKVMEDIWIISTILVYENSQQSIQNSSMRGMDYHYKNYYERYGLSLQYNKGRGIH